MTSRRKAQEGRGNVGAPGVSRLLQEGEARQGHPGQGVHSPFNSGKTKVMPDVSTSSPSVTPKDVTGMLNDHTKHLTNHLHYMLENGLVKIFKTLNPSTDSGSVFGTPQAPCSSAQHEALKNPLYGMPKNITPSQSPPVMSTLLLRPETAMVISPPIVEPLNSIPSSAATSRTNELASFVPPYQTVAYSTPPILSRGTGIPHSSVPDYYFNNKYGALDRVPRTEHRWVFVNSFEECLATVREDLKKQMRETFRVELSSKSCIYQKPHPSHFDLVPYPVGWRTPNFVKFSGEDNRTMWEHVSQYLAQLGEVGSNDALKTRLFSLLLTDTDFLGFLLCHPILLIRGNNWSVNFMITFIVLRMRLNCQI
jgi:hypothetical protein